MMSSLSNGRKKSMIFDPSKRCYKCIDGNWASKMPVGFCTFKHHEGYITNTQMRSKGCLQKGCKYFVEVSNHPRWERRERVKKEKRVRKQSLCADLQVKESSYDV